VCVFTRRGGCHHHNSNLLVRATIKKKLHKNSSAPQPKRRRRRSFFVSSTRFVVSCARAALNISRGSGGKEMKKISSCASDKYYKCKQPEAICQMGPKAVSTSAQHFRPLYLFLLVCVLKKFWLPFCASKNAAKLSIMKLPARHVPNECFAINVGVA